MTRAEIRRRARGIPFRDELVPLIMRGLKTQSRRLLTGIDHPISYAGWDDDGEDGPGFYASDVDSGQFEPAECWHRTKLKPPYGPHGSILYVKEAIERREDRWVYRADGADVAGTLIGTDDPDLIRDGECWLEGWQYGKRTPYRSTRFMPKWAARTFLKVADVRVQRVAEITEEDAIAEGMIPSSPLWPAHANIARHAFRITWDLFHGAGAWERNDWLWAYTFRLIE